jgi:hypothetical protein
VETNALLLLERENNVETQTWNIRYWKRRLFSFGSHHVFHVVRTSPVRGMISIPQDYPMRRPWPRPLEREATTSPFPSLHL